MTSPSEAKALPDRSNIELAIVENSKWIDRVIWTEGGLALTVVAAKFAGVTEFEWEHVKFNISAAWVVFTLLTVAHLYTALLLINSIKRYWNVSDIESRMNLFDKVTASGGLLVRGLIARTEYDEKDEFGFVSGGVSYRSVSYRMSPNDPSAWAALLGAVLLFAAVFPFSLDIFHFWYFGMFWLALTIVQANWTIGSHWVIALSDLTNESSVYFNKVIKFRSEFIGSFGPSNPLSTPFASVFLSVFSVLSMLPWASTLVYLAIAGSLRWTLANLQKLTRALLRAVGVK